MLSNLLNSNKVCPLCCKVFGYDGKSCFNCGMKITDITDTHIKFFFPKKEKIKIN